MSELTYAREVLAEKLYNTIRDMGEGIGEIVEGLGSYSGPVMHASELLVGRMARDMLDTPGVYVVCVVEDPDDLDNPHSWTLLELAEVDA